MKVRASLVAALAAAVLAGCASTVAGRPAILPVATSGVQIVTPTGAATIIPTLGTSIPTDIPGLDPECSAALSSYTAIGLLLISPFTQKTVTQADVDAAFASTAQAPADIQDELQILRAATEAMVGKSPADGMSVVADPDVTSALQRLGQYLQSSCGTGG